MNPGWDYGPYWLAGTIAVMALYILVVVNWPSKRTIRIFDWEQECPWLRKTP